MGNGPLTRAALVILLTATAIQAQDGPRATTLKVPARADVNAIQPDGMTALHQAAERGDSAATAALLRVGANVGATTRIGDYTPLHIAARTGSAPVVRALLKAGANVKAVTTSGATALHFGAESGDAGVIEALLAHKADPNARETEWGQTPLIFAAAANRPAAIRALVKGGADPSPRTNAVNIQEQTAAEQAAARKRNAVLVAWEPERHKDTSRSVGQQADTARRATPQPKGPFTPAQIQAAVDSGRLVLKTAAAARGPAREEVDTINGGVAGFAQTVGGVGGLTPLHHAVRQGNVAAVEALLESGAAIDARSSADSTTPLLQAAINGQFDVAMLLVRKGANVKIPSVHGATPLYATVNAHWRMKSRFPQPQAAEYQKTTHMELMQALLEAGAEPNARINTHLWYFAYNNCGSGNCGLENTEGTTAFWRAAYSLDLEAMRLLVKFGADPNLPSQRTVRPVQRPADVETWIARAGRSWAPRLRRSTRRRRPCPPALACIPFMRQRAWATATASRATRTGMRPTAGCRL